MWMILFALALIAVVAVAQKDAVNSVAFLVIVIALIAMMVVVARGEYVTPYEGLNVRARPTTHSESLGVLEFGTEVVDVDDEPIRGWMAIMYEGRLAYVAKEFLSEEVEESLGTWHITAYAATGWPCANGAYPTVGYTIAHNSLPFGTKVYIEGVGVRVVEDRGPTWLGDEWCDLYLGDYWPCVEWGSQYREVWIID